MGNIRENPGIVRGSNEWARFYNKRVSVERLFSRGKEFRRLDDTHYRGLAKVSIHVYLSTLTIVASALAAVYSQQSLRRVA